MNDIVAQIKKQPNLDVIEKAEHWEIRLVRPEGVIFEIMIPRTVLEWFVTAKIETTGKKVWSDWMDYYSADGETDDELRSQMKADIERFVERLRLSTVRVVESKTFLGRKKRLEWRANGGWEKPSIYFGEN